MKEFLLVFRGDLDFNTASPEVLQQTSLNWQEWMKKLADEGRFEGGGKRLTQKVGAVLKGRKQISDGPYVEGKEIVGGYLLLKANDLQEAIEVSKDCPIFNHDGLVEVREVALP